MVFLLLEHNATKLELLVGVQVMYGTKLLAEAYIIRDIGKSGNCIILVLKHRSFKLVPLAQIKVKDTIKILDEVFLTRVIGKYGIQISVKGYIPMVTGKYGTYIGYDWNWCLPMVTYKDGNQARVYCNHFIVIVEDMN